MKLFFKFIYKYKLYFISFIAFTALYITVLFLYNISAEPIIYSSMICFVIGIIITDVNFIKFKREHDILEKIYADLPILPEKMPETSDINIRQLYNIIERLGEINDKNLIDLKTSRQDSIDYFTVWVHQIKTPIAAMQMILQNEDTAVNRELSGELFKIEQYAEMALHYLRLDSKYSDYLIKKYDLDSMIKQAVHRYAPQFVRRKIKLFYEPVNAKVLTDEKWLVFIIEQLLSNAVKYTPSGSVSIRFSDNVLSVSDTGIGISAEDLPRIFEKGYTGMSGRKDKKSTGLGLYLCKKAADNLNHKLWAESRTGEGTKIFIDLSTRNIDIF